MGAHLRIALALMLFGAGACGKEVMGGGGDDVQDMPDAATTPGNWTTLISKNWTLPANGENESDLQIVTLDREIVVGGIRPIAPVGTHHTLLFKGLSGTNAIYASGVGTGELIFPATKGMRFTVGTTIGLQLHIYNTSDEPLTGLSGIEVIEVNPAEVTEEVDLFLPGPRQLDIDPGVYTTTGTCTVTAPQSLFALFPHMHQLGTHFKTTLTKGGQDMVLHDAAYDFEHQDVKSFTPIQLSAGDKIKTDCTWNNTSGGQVGWGESSDTEMCFSILYRYPSQGGGEFCTQ